MSKKNMFGSSSLFFVFTVLGIFSPIKVKKREKGHIISKHNCIRV